MLSKKNANTISVDTLIGKATVIEGNITLTGTIRIDGTVKGEIDSKGDIIISETAKTVGNITGTNIIISGNVEGNITAKEQLRLTPTAKLTGDIKMNSFIADDGAMLNGNCQMADKTEQTSKGKSTKNK